VTGSYDETGRDCSSFSKKTYVPRSCGSKTLSFRPSDVTIFSRPKIYGHSTASELRLCGVRPCVRRIWTATSFYHCYVCWTSWLQPLDSSV
jgi:hypothetical protein